MQKAKIERGDQGIDGPAGLLANGKNHVEQTQFQKNDRDGLQGQCALSETFQITD